MRYLYFLLFIVFPSLCFSQNEIKIKMSYDENNNMLLVSVLNESDNLLGVNKGSEGLNELNGSIVYLSKTFTKGAMNKLRTFLWEYDADKKCYVLLKNILGYRVKTEKFCDTFGG